MITEVILIALRDHLEERLITLVEEGEPARVGVVKIGPLQGEPDVDVARISLEIYANDPEKTDEREDQIVEWEMPMTAIWERHFTILWRALLAETGEGLLDAMAIASDLKHGIEEGVRTLSWASLSSGNERAIGCGPETMEHRIQQGGGPNEYDWTGKLTFTVQTAQQL